MLSDPNPGVRDAAISCIEVSKTVISSQFHVIASICRLKNFLFSLDGKERIFTSI